MCTYTTVTTSLDGSAKGPGGNWFHVTDGIVYFDHPVHALAEHTLNIDFSAPADGPSARVAVEAGVAQCWHKLVGDTGEIVSIEHYGASADDKTLFREFGFTPEAVVAAAERSMDN